jgi:hypothetical protein
LPSIAATTMISSEPGKTSGIYDDFPKDQLLQVSRRLDWRFLLPNPDLGRVAYLGPEEDSLVDALHLFCHTLTQISSSQLSATGLNDFDLVVITNPSNQSLELGAQRVKPGGYLYVETYGWSRAVKPRVYIKYCYDFFRLGESPGQPWSPPHIRTVIRMFGFQKINTFWHWPNFESCTRIIGLDDTDSRTIAFTFQENGIQLFLKKALTRGLLPSKWVQYWVPYFSIIAGKDSL